MTASPQRQYLAIFSGWGHGLGADSQVWRIIRVSCLMAGAAFAAFIWSTGRGESVEHARTLAVNAIVMLEIFYLLSVRALGSNSLSMETFVGSRPAVLGVGLSLTLQTMFTYTPIMQLVFQTEAISAADPGGTTRGIWKPAHIGDGEGSATLAQELIGPNNLARSGAQHPRAILGGSRLMPHRPPPAPLLG